VFGLKSLVRVLPRAMTLRELSSELASGHVSADVASGGGGLAYTQNSRAFDYNFIDWSSAPIEIDKLQGYIFAID